MIRLIQKIIMISVFMVTPILASEIPVEDFAKSQLYQEVKISPSGQYLAAIFIKEDKRTLGILDIKSLEIVSSTSFTDDEEVGDFTWVNDERVVMTIWGRKGSLATPVDYSELYAINVDNSKKGMIFGYRAESKRVMKLSKIRGAEKTRGSHKIINLLVDDPKHILIAVYLWDREKNERLGVFDTKPIVYKLNVYSGAMRKEENYVPVNYATFISNRAGDISHIIGIRDSFDDLEVFEKTDGKWLPFTLPVKIGDEDLKPIGMSADNSNIFYIAHHREKNTGLYQYNIANKASTLIFRDKHADIGSVIKDPLTNEPVGVYYSTDYTYFHLFNKKNSYASILEASQGAFPTSTVKVTSVTKGYNTAVIEVSSDKDAGSFYLFQKKENRILPLVVKAPWLDVNKLANSSPFMVKTADKLTLHGYVTLPLGKQKNLPTVVLVHGGPNVRDNWEYSQEAQLLASRGYAVIQVNYRGSSGYGSEFRNLSNLHWGTTVQDDIAAAAQKAIRAGISDPERICISGWSFGGYSALISGIKHEDLYACAISGAGMSDLVLTREEDILEGTKKGERYLKKALGNDKESLKEQSVITHVKKLKIPLLIVHGGEDETVEPIHSEKLVAELKKYKKEFEYLYKEYEGHGFSSEVNRTEYYTKMLAFLDKHIGSKKTN